MTILINRMNAWKNLFKLGSFAKLSKQMGNYFRNIVILGLKDNFLSFLKFPRSFSEIKNEFKITDENFLYLLLDTLLDDNTIEKTNKGLFFLKKSLDIDKVPPAIFDESLAELAENMANSVFNRLHNEYLDLSSGTNLFVFDDTLSRDVYERIRRSAIGYVPSAIENPGRFLDLGCGSGTETADFWVHIMNECNFQPDNGFKLIAVDINEDFINIANSEFCDITKKYLDLTEEAFFDLKPYYPEFKTGSLTQIPYPDNYFDHIFVSQALHWTDLKSSLVEIYRCLKPEGTFFGTNLLIPHANPYLNIMLKSIKGVGGFFTKEEFVSTAKQVGFSKLKFCTPLTIFKFKK